MEIVFLAAAQAELDETVLYYARQREGLGDDFADEVERAIKRIIQFPQAWSLVSGKTHRCITNRFSYGVLYQVRGNILFVVAIMHLHREPDSWKSRLPMQER